MALEDKIKIIVEAEVNGAIAQMQRMQAQTAKTKESITGFSGVMTRFPVATAAAAAGAAAAGYALLNFGSQAYDSATKIQAFSAQVDRLFKDNAADIAEFAEIAEVSLGISERAVYQFSATYGNLLSGFITDSDTLTSRTQELLQQSAVVAAATGRTIEDVNERIRSGLLGNTESIEDLGINVNVAMLEATEAFQKLADGKSWEQLDFYTQQQIRLTAILEQSYVKYGDTIEDNVISKQNKLKASYENLQTEIGKTFVPLAEDILPEITEHLRVINDEYLDEIVATMQLLGHATLIVGNSFGALIDILKAGASTLTYLVMAPITELISLLSTVYVPNIVDFTGLEGTAIKMRAVTDSITVSLLDSANSARTNSQQIVDSVSAMYDIITGRSKETTEEVKKVTKQVKEAVEQTPITPSVDEDEMKRLQDLLLDFQIRYLHSIGEHEQAIRLQLDKEVADYAEVVTDKLALDVYYQNELQDRLKAYAEETKNRNAEIMLEFEQNYLNMQGRFTEAAKLSIDEQAQIYIDAGVDRLRVEEWVNNEILNASTDLYSGIQRGFRDIAQESADYATGIQDVITNAFGGAEDALTSFITTGQMDFASFTDAIISDIARLAIQMAIIKPLAESLSGFLGGGITGGSATPDFSTYFQHHNGGMVGTSGTKTSASPSLFTNARRYHNGGMIGADEVPIIAQRGERVLSRAETTEYNKGTSGAGVNVYVNNYSSATVETKQTQNEDGSVDIELLIGDMVAKQMNTPGSSLNYSAKNLNRSNQLVRR